ncbi:MFS transporter [Nocardiopsis deserti]|uniref:MFS transporter n=1 Tax=Nocardiopsis deserti TaxID=2605988 RepID=UPI00123B2EC2|nr:MFS transporter [Nocardiopsis deserti]
MTGSVDARRSTGPPRRALFVVMAALSVLPVTVYLPVLPDIADALDASFALVNLSIAGYAVATATVEVVSGALSDRYGRRPVVLVSVSVFVVASVGCALASDIAFFLVCRMFQASIAACFSVAMVAIKETSSDRDAVRRIGFASMGWALAPMVGPALGGVLGELFGWRSIFATLAVLGGAVLLVSVYQMKETSLRSGAGRGDFLSSLRRLLGSPRFWAYTLCMAFSTGTLYVFLGGAPLVMGSRFGASSAALGIHMAMVPGGFILGSYLTGAVASRVFRSHVLVGARALTCGGLLTGLVLAASHDISPLVFFVFCVFIGVGNGLTTPVVTMGVMSEHDDLAGTATGLSAAMSIGGGALVSSSAGLLLGATSAVHDLLALLLASASLALVAALLAALADRRPRA